MSLRRTLLKPYHVARGITAANLFGFPARGLTLAGVTGTDGKSSTVTYLANICSATDKPTGWVSSISAKIGDHTEDTGPHTTTPTPFALQSYLRDMARAHIHFGVLEVTSHGIDQWRIFGIPFEVAILTNVTHEHLDYHGTIADYRATKIKFLADTARRGGVAVTNRDDMDTYPYIAQVVSADHLLTYGEHPEADVRLMAIQCDLAGSRAQCILPDQTIISLEVATPGRVFIQNAAAAVAGAWALGIDAETITTGIANTKIIDGRFERITTGEDYDLIVDIAHTPNALQKLYEFVKPHVRGRLIAVFGSAGERDAKKREPMGRIVGTYADYVIVTREDNRSERVEDIAATIASGLEAAGKKRALNYVFNFDRQAAINAAVAMAKSGDVVLFTGKGPESGLNIDGTEIEWDDRTAARRAVALRHRPEALFGDEDLTILPSVF